MITTTYITFLQSFLSSLLGLSIVFLSLIFLAIFVTIVSRVVEKLESRLKDETAAKNVKATSVAPEPVKKNDDVKIAVITAAISEETKLPLDRFTITSIEKI